MSERQLQFRVGLLVITSFVIAVVLTFQFGKLERFFKKKYAIAIHFSEAPGLQAGTPVRMNGINIGTVAEVRIDQKRGGVLGLLKIDEDRKLRVDAQAQISRSLLGDTSIEFTPGRAEKFIEQGDLLKGAAPSDPFEVVNRLERQVTKSLESFTDTSMEWRKVAANINDLMETNKGSLDKVVNKAADALNQLTQTMMAADSTIREVNSIVADPLVQQNLKRTIEAMPKLVDETRSTITSAKNAVQTIEASMANIQKATDPLAESTPEMINQTKRILSQTEQFVGRTEKFVANADTSLTQVNQVLKEMQTITKGLAEGDGTFQRLAKDPTLYRNLNSSAAQLSVLMQNLDVVLRDVRIFSDKIARHPELLGVSGAIRGSSGVKDPNIEQSLKQLTSPQSQRRNSTASPSGSINLRTKRN